MTTTGCHHQSWKWKSFLSVYCPRAALMRVLYLRRWHCCLAVFLWLQVWWACLLFHFLEDHSGILVIPSPTPAHKNAETICLTHDSCGRDDSGLTQWQWLCFPCVSAIMETVRRRVVTQPVEEREPQARWQPMVQYTTAIGNPSDASLISHVPYPHWIKLKR